MANKVVWDLPVKYMLPVYGSGFLWLLTSTFALDHFDLFGIKQGTGVDIMKKLGLGLNGYCNRAHYKLCRHPIMLGFFIMFLGVPKMTYNHMFFSASCIAYILLAVYCFEEPDLCKEFGDDYLEY